MESAHGWSDFLGIAASIGCAIHCAALPLFIAVLPAWGLGWLVHESVHKWMFAVCVLIAIIAFLPSLFRHRNVSPIALGCMGLTCIGLGAFSDGDCSCSSCSSCVAVAQTTKTTPEIKAEATGKQFEKISSRIETPSKKLAMLVATGEAPRLVSRFESSPAVNDISYCWAITMIWITPIGGVLLVSAHLLNHHLSYFCRC